MQPTQSIYPSFELKSSPSFAQNPSVNNPTPCKPVAIISHGNEITLITCSKTVGAEGAPPVCQHQEYGSHSTLPLAALIQDLQCKGYSVYSQNSEDGSFTDHLPKLQHDELAEEMETSDAAFMASPQDLEARPFDENALVQLLPPEAINPLAITQQTVAISETPADLQPSTSSAPSLNQSLPTADTRSAQQVTLIHATTRSQSYTATNAVTTNQPPSTSAAASTSAAPSAISTSDRETLCLALEALSPHASRKIYCILSVLHTASAPLSRHECINSMRTRFADFSAISASSAYGSSFATAVRLGLIEKIGNVNSLGGIKYRILPAGAQFIMND